MSPSNSEKYLETLLSERQDYAERIMARRLVLLQRWIKNMSPPKARPRPQPAAAVAAAAAARLASGRVARRVSGGARAGAQMHDKMQESNKKLLMARLVSTVNLKNLAEGSQGGGAPDAA